MNVRTQGPLPILAMIKKYSLLQLALATASSSAWAELTPLPDAALADISGQAGLVFNLQTRIQASEIRYSQHNNDGSERGSVSLNNLDIFAPSAQQLPNGDIQAGTPEEAFADSALRGPTVFGINSGVLDGLRATFETLGVLNFDPTDSRTGEPLTLETLNIDVLGNHQNRPDAAPTSALRLVLPQLTQTTNEAFAAIADLSPAERNLLAPIIVSVLSEINVLAEFDLAVNDTPLGQFRLGGFIDLDTVLYLYGNNDGSSGLNIDIDLGLGFGEITYRDTDQDGGQISLKGVRIGQVSERPDQAFIDRGFFGFRTALGAPLRGLSLNVEIAEVTDLSTGLSRETSLLAIDLPDIENLDFTIDSIEIGDAAIGGLDILNINTLVENSDVQRLNQTFGQQFALGDHSQQDSQGVTRTGYQLRGQANLSGTANNGLQLNAAWGGQIDSLQYHDGPDGILAFNDITVFAQGDNAEGQAILTPFQFEGTLHLTEQGIELGNINTQGSIAIQSVTVGNSNLGALHIDNFQLRNSHITISGQ